MTANMTERTMRPAVLCILDGWGHRPQSEDNAWALAKTPNLDRLFDSCPHALLETSGEAVGLPAGQMGNSEVGHMNIGGGRVVKQDLPRIDEAVATGTLAQNAELCALIEKVRASDGRAHIMGLLSPGGVHSHQDHIVALARIVSEAGAPVVLHAFLDGRDTPPSSARGYLEQVQAQIEALPDVHFGTITGRYYAMDRDKRWDRVELAYRGLVDGDGAAALSALDAIDGSYADEVTDEFVLPAIIDGYHGMADGDALIMANFRADRAREILTAFLDPAFDGFNRSRLIAFSGVAGMVEYSAALAEMMPALFPPERLTGTLGEVVAKAGLNQLRIAETEKYGHVTFFFNGGEEAVFDHEDRILVPSPKVATYDLQPEMSADEVTDRLVAAIGGGRYDLIVCNFANPDMVGHTGILTAAIKAMEAVDRCVGRVNEAVLKAGGALLLTADHGNLEMMSDPKTGQPHTAHTEFRVPVLVSGAQVDVRDGRLADVAPTMLALMGLEKPAVMTGTSLIGPQAAPRADAGVRAQA